MSCEQEKYEVVIVGAGVIGAATAYQIAQAYYPANITVVDAVGPATAASGKAGGFLAREWCGYPVNQLAETSFDMHKKIDGAMAEAVEYRAVRTIGVDVGDDPASGRSGPLPDWLDGAGVAGANSMGDENNTAQVTPALLVSEMLTASGAKVVKGRVTGLVTSDTGHARAVQIEGGDDILAHRIILCMGPWTSAASDWVGCPLPVSGARAHSIVMKPQDDDKDSVTADCVFIHWRGPGGIGSPEIYPRPSGEVYMCGGDDDTPLPDNPADVTYVEATCDGIEALAHKVSSVLERSERIVSQACYLPVSRDGIPLIGFVPNSENSILVGAGHSCWGILNSHVTGKILADLAINGRTEAVADIGPFDPGRFA